ncbi:hypothetical protein L1D14_04075 [Vibrio tubiashii]|uniref:hypothetical protein n=1 Tax=Vibrio tubiashii TaxID=29498 RepID=UPI001EFE6C54|nr:hypothetical protein [Vibrio tubiashii]MCG9575408.1 hypothetical protein [Vibrio tubiashii]
MARVTVNRILDAFCAKYGLKREYIEMIKSEGTYHLCGKFAAVMSKREMNTHMVRLNDWTLERWLENFDSIIEAEGWQDTDLNTMIETIEWTV